jgi:hypothetical protein
VWPILGEAVMHVTLQRFHTAGSDVGVWFGLTGHGSA